MNNIFILSFLLGVAHALAFNTFGMSYLPIGIALSFLDLKRVMTAIQEHEEVRLAQFVNVFTTH